MTKEALKLALEALEFFEDTAICQADIDVSTEAITAIKEVLAQQEPTAIGKSVASEEEYWRNEMLYGD